MPPAAGRRNITGGKHVRIPRWLGTPAPDLLLTEETDGKVKVGHAGQRTPPTCLLPAPTHPT
ncbi:hypothetical protein GCM10012285_44810 [Streptomyces kronopolitis]|uniref:Uncharacterized protein n=1 Tax=Streptomyces kronopolitis TaxID=1612435 RepID=A0ABQ2JSL1_9ACTN|nr:hypothetical protein GCM10012285_44810 [Streptomyces kronopolitis]